MSLHKNNPLLPGMRHADVIWAVQRKWYGLWRAKFAAIFPHLDERQRRLLMGAEARALGHGGIRVVARAAGVREATVSLGADELDSGNAKTIERGPPMAAQGPALRSQSPPRNRMTYLSTYRMTYLSTHRMTYLPTSGVPDPRAYLRMTREPLFSCEIGI
jgi:hypothetical protein